MTSRESEVGSREQAGGPSKRRCASAQRRPRPRASRRACRCQTSTVADRVSIVSILRAYGSFLALAALVVYNILFTPNFLSAGTLNANLTQVATIVIVAVGMTFVIATGGIDLSVGSLMAIAGVLAPLFLLDGQQFGTPVGGPGARDRGAARSRRRSAERSTARWSPLSVCSRSSPRSCSIWVDAESHS